MHRDDPVGRFRSIYLPVPVQVGPGGGATWARALCREREMRSRAGTVVVEDPDALLIGGGAPELLGSDLVEQVRAVLPGASSLPSEWTVEVGPGRVRPSDLMIWKAGGVTRVCLRADPSVEGDGWDEERLDHLQEVAVVGFDVLAVDLLVGPTAAPGAERRLAARIERLRDAGVDHVSVYERASDAGGPAAIDRDERTGAQWRTVLRSLREHGYGADDLLNHSRPGCSSRYARALRNRRPILGLGPGATSFRNPHRRWNVPEWQGYLARLEEGRDPVARTEHLDAESVLLERIWLRLQGARGVCLPRNVPGLESSLRRWAAAGWAEFTGRRLRLTPDGWLRIDGIAVEIAAALAALDAAPGTPDL